MAILASMEQQVDQVDVLQLETSIIDTGIKRTGCYTNIRHKHMFVSSRNSVLLILNGKVWGNVRSVGHNRKCRISPTD